jgi:hypothetical protein
MNGNLVEESRLNGMGFNLSGLIDSLFSGDHSNR